MATPVPEGSVATNKPKLTAYVETAVNHAIDEEARKERRSKSQMVALLIEEALKARGYEFPTDPDAQSPS